MKGLWWRIPFSFVLAVPWAFCAACVEAWFAFLSEFTDESHYSWRRKWAMVRERRWISEREWQNRWRDE